MESVWSESGTSSVADQAAMELFCTPHGSKTFQLNVCFADVARSTGCKTM